MAQAQEQYIRLFLRQASLLGNGNGKGNGNGRMEWPLPLPVVPGTMSVLPRSGRIQDTTSGELFLPGRTTGAVTPFTAGRKGSTMSEELEKQPSEEPAAPPQDPSAGFTDDKPAAPAGEALLSALKEAESTPLAPQRPNTTANVLMLAGIAVVVVGAAVLIVLGPTFSLNRPATSAKAQDPALHARQALYKWEGMDVAKRRATLPELVGAFKLDDEDLRLQLLMTIPDAGADAVPELVKGLKDEDLAARFYCAWALARIGPDAAEAVPALLAARTDPEGEVRRKVIFALGRIHPRAEQAVPVLVDALKDDDAGVQGTAVEALAGYGKATVPALTKALRDPSFQVRRQAVLALTRIGPDAGDALAALAPLYRDRASGLQNEAADALRSLGAPAIAILAEPLGTNPVLPSGQVVAGLGSPWALLGLWRDYAADHRRALKALGDIGPDALPVLLAALKNPNVDVRQAAAGELGRLGLRDRRIVSPLAGALRDPEEVVRHQAGFALRRLAPDTRLLLPELAAALKSPDVEVRINAVEFLGQLGSPAAPLLAEALKDPDGKVYTQAINSFAGLETDDDQVIAVMKPLLKDERPQVRQNAVLALAGAAIVDGQLKIPRGRAKALPLLVEALKDPEAAIRRDAIWSVVNIQGDEKLIRPALDQAFVDPDAQVRAQATVGLGAIGFRAIDQLEKALQDKAVNVRLEAIKGLARLNSTFTRALPAIRPALKDENAAVRLIAVGGLKKFGEDAVPLLIEAFKDDNDDVWKLAKKVLLEIEVPDDVLLRQMLQALEDRDKFVRQGVVYVMARFGAKGVAPLAKAMRDSDPGVQARAADALDDIARRDPDLVRPEIAALAEAATNTSNDKLRRNALMALTTIHGFTDREYQTSPAKAVPGLIDMLDDPNKRWGAIKTLEAIGPTAKDAIPALSKLATDSDLNVSTAASAALRRIRPKE
jgi:HEAT repeat protein